MIKKWANTYSYFLALIRWNDWHDVRIPFVFIVILYFQYTTALLGDGLVVYLKFTSIFFFSVCYYAFLFLSNDYFDFNQDVRSGKGNKKRNRSVILALTWLLWIASVFFLLLSWNNRSVVQILIASVGYGLAFFYSAPPLRFKERNYWGIIVGSTVLRPMCILMILAGLVSIDKLYEILVYTLWMEALGIRTMLFHQIDDYRNDRKARVHTFVTQRGVALSRKLIASIFLPAEAVMFLLVSIILMINIPSIPYIVFIYGLYLLWTKLRNPWTWKTVPHYRPLFGSVVFFLLPVYLALLVAIRYSLWFIPFFVFYWQRRFAIEFFQRFSTKMR